MAQLETLAFRIAATNETEAAFHRVNRDLGNLASMTKLSGQQLAQMQFQLQDIAVSLAAGQSPFTVLMQQGSQMAQMFQSGTGVRGALQAVGTGIVSFVTNPLNLAVLGFAAVAGVAAKLFSSLQRGADDARQLATANDLVSESLARIKEGYNAATGAVIIFGRNVSEVTKNSLALGLRAQTDELDKLRKTLASSLGDLTGDIDRLVGRFPVTASEASKVFLLFQEFERQVRAGLNPSIEDLRARLERMAAAGSPAMGQLAIYIEDVSKAALDQEEQVRKVEAGLRLLEGTATDADRALLGLSGAIGQSGDAALAALGPLGQYLGVLRDIAGARVVGGGLVGSIIDGAVKATRMLEGAAVLAREFNSVLRPEVPGMPVPSRNPSRDLTSDFGVAEAHAAAASAARDAASAERELERARESLARQADSLIGKLFPEEAAKRQLEELTAQFEKFGDALDPLQRKAIQIQIEVLTNGGTLEDYIAKMKSPADQLRDAFKELKKDAQDFASTLIDGLMRGESLIATLNTAVGNLAKRLADRALTNLFSGNLIGAAISGIGALIATLFGKITQKLKEVQELRDSIDRRLNEASGRGYVNSVQDLVTQHNKDRQTALFSGDPDLIAKEMAAFQGGVRSFLAGANLTADQLNDLAGAFPDLAKVIAEFRKKAIDEAVRDIQARINDARGLGFLNTIGDLFQQFQKDVAVVGGKLAGTALYDGVRAFLNGADLTLVELNKLAKAFPLLGNIVAEFRKKAIAGLADDITRRINEVSGKGYLNQAQDLLGQYRTDVGNAQAAGRPDLVTRARDLYIASLQALVDQSNLTGDAFAELTKLFPSFSGKLHEATGAVDDFRASIADYLDSLKTGDLSTLNPAEKLAAAGDQFSALLAAAQGGDQTARDKLTQGADTYLKQAQDYYASSEGYARIYDAVTAALKNIAGMAAGGLVPVAGLAAGGMVGNGLWNRDSVLARYAGGGAIALAGGEFVVNAGAARANLHTLQAINRGGGNDNADIRELVADMKRLIRLTAESGSGQMQTVRAGLAEVRAAMDRLTETTRTEATRESRLRRQSGR